MRLNIHEMKQAAQLVMDWHCYLKEGIVERVKMNVTDKWERNTWHYSWTTLILISGVFSLNLSDPGYLTKPLYTFDVAVQCPKQFSLNFTIPSGDARTMSRDIHVQVRDKKGVNILVVHSVGLQEDYSACMFNFDSSLAWFRSNFCNMSSLIYLHQHFASIYCKTNTVCHVINMIILSIVI